MHIFGVLYVDLHRMHEMIPLQLRRTGRSWPNLTDRLVDFCNFSGKFWVYSLTLLLFLSRTPLGASLDDQSASPNRGKWLSACIAHLLPQPVTSSIPSQHKWKWEILTLYNYGYVSGGILQPNYSVYIVLVCEQELQGTAAALKMTFYWEQKVSTQ